MECLSNGAVQAYYLPLPDKHNVAYYTDLHSYLPRHQVLRITAKDDIQINLLKELSEVEELQV